MAKLKGKVALITGSGRGIGRAIALKLASEGARVVVNDLDAAPGDAVADEIKAAGGEAIAVTAASQNRALPIASSRPPPILSAGSTSSSTMPATPGTRRSRR